MSIRIKKRLIMKLLKLSKEEFNKLPSSTIVMCSANGSDLYSTVFSEFKLCPEELKDGLAEMKRQEIPFSENDAKGNFSNSFILDYLWMDDSKNGNNTETIIFYEGKCYSAIVD